ncbi:hypothetical protein EJ05DRAFT_499513 [Pseudovirgaria hyperparasitica]|uniref:GPI anchored cell wall protein n=1 Tax=Pseudovirgaria hyperparasitica TaxID=470096 RepID=A0A6A6WA90_9PEZI|nr:uncharacterized protein EJ05DRAFT_499513 [Pseudovirgaria hyperparasitica]KAF2759089.1 hypothetical protein EJ05DRAFT_499513 [Pseudovirgaria hyperparasitica]
MKSFATLALLSGIAIAQSTTVDVFLLPPNYSASVVTVDATATTMVLSCPTDAPEDPDEFDGCYADAFTVTAGPELFYAEFTEAFGEESNSIPVVTATISCSIGGTTTASCDQTMIGTVEGEVLTTSFATEYSSGELVFSPATVTAGADKLSAATGSPEPTSDSPSSNPSSPAHTGSLITRTTPAPTGSQPTGGSPTTEGSAPADTGAASANLIRGASIAGLAGVAAAMLAL